MTRDQLLALPDHPDPIAAMTALPALAELPTWATAEADEAIARWTAACVRDERSAAARAAEAAALAVVDRLPPDAEDSLVGRAWVDAQVTAVRAWIADPTPAHQALARASFDPTRQTNAWSDFEMVDGWVAETADFAVHTVWSGALEGDVTPPAPRACAALAAVCAARALMSDGVGSTEAVVHVARAVARALAG